MAGGTSYTKAQNAKIQAGHAAFRRANPGRDATLKDHKAILKAAGVKYKPLGAKGAGRTGAKGAASGGGG